MRVDQARAGEAGLLLERGNRLGAADLAGRQAGPAAHLAQQRMALREADARCDLVDVQRCGLQQAQRGLRALAQQVLVRRDAVDRVNSRRK